jgi:hypothetical protein
MLPKHRPRYLPRLHSDACVTRQSPIETGRVNTSAYMLATESWNLFTTLWYLSGSHHKIIERRLLNPDHMAAFGKVAPHKQHN